MIKFGSWISVVVRNVLFGLFCVGVCVELPEVAQSCLKSPYSTQVASTHLKLSIMFLCICSVCKRSQVMSKYDKNKKVAHEAELTMSLTFLPHFDILCDLLLCASTAIWYLFLLFNEGPKNC